MNRRTFIATTSLFTAGLPLAQAAHHKRKFTIDLTPGAIGVNARGVDLINLAAKHGFESIQPNPGTLLSLSKGQRKEFVQLMEMKKLRWGAAGLPVDFRQSGEKFTTGMKQLPTQAAVLRDAGVTRVGTWLRPSHQSLTYLANFKQHAKRLREVTKVLAGHGLRFGLEYVGTWKNWTSDQHPFIHSMAETKELIAEIDQPTLGFVLDSWHWFTAGESDKDLLTLKNKDIVACDLNDAPKGLAIKEQIDNRRELPAATGVIDVASFLKALAGIGYDGPVRAEPFNQPLRKLDDDPAAKATADGIRKAIRIAGL
ncbi:MAG: xylose isomerase [Verrucomicrobiales bacterium]|nr:xylose isomerase [Verrucomicrobiales bacterium]|tara:strand:- start:41 stop:976 length:936 start_codon:yes stop_codon:yes gene_type:complete